MGNGIWVSIVLGGMVVIAGVFFFLNVVIAGVYCSKLIWSDVYCASGEATADYGDEMRMSALM